MWGKEVDDSWLFGTHHTQHLYSNQKNMEVYDL